MGEKLWDFGMKRGVSLCSPGDFPSRFCPMVSLDLSLRKLLQLNSPRMRKTPFLLWFMFPGVKMYPCLGLPWVKYKQGEARLRNWGSLGAPLSQTPHHGPIPVAFGPEIKYNTFNLKLYHRDIQNFPSLLCVANAALAVPSLTPTGACNVYKGECVLWARLRIKRRPGNKKKGLKATRNGLRKGWFTKIPCLNSGKCHMLPQQCPMGIWMQYRFVRIIFAAPQNWSVKYSCWRKWIASVFFSWMCK